MTDNIKINENSFDPAPGGTAGSVNVQPSLGTFSSPDVSQNPASFDSSDYNKYYNKLTTGQPDTFKSSTSGSFDRDVDLLFKKKEKPTIDDVLAGIQYELANMIKKDKRLAKERVIDNMKKYGAKYYTNLGMLNIDDKKMDVTPILQENNEKIKKQINELNSIISLKKKKVLKLVKEIKNINKFKKTFYKP